MLSDVFILFSFIENLSPTGQALVWVSVLGFFLYGGYQILKFFN